MMWILLSAALVIALGGCGTANLPWMPRPEAASRRIFLAAPVTGGRGYTIVMPRDVIRQPPDGPMIHFAGEGIRIRLDYGPNYEQPSCIRPRCRVRFLTIDGHTARTFGVRISNPGSVFERRIWIMIDVSPDLKLGLDVVCGGPGACARAGRIVRSIEFRR